MTNFSTDIRDYEESEWDALLDAVADGVPLKTACNVKNRPYYALVRRRIREDSDFAARMDVARRESVYAIEDEIIQIADDDARDTMEVTAMSRAGPYQTTRPATEVLRRAEIRIRARQHRITRLDPRPYEIDPESNKVIVEGGFGG